MDALVTTIDRPIEDAEPLVRDALAAQGFGVLTEIDIAATLKAKLDVDRPPLKILGACNPGFAHRALQLDPTASLVLPCNVVLEPDGAGGTTVSVVDPRSLMPGDEFAELAGEAAGLLQAALDQIGA
jgi:uncharacterized protein (DUF302 family)